MSPKYRFAHSRFRSSTYGRRVARRLGVRSGGGGGRRPPPRPLKGTKRARLAPRTKTRGKAKPKMHKNIGRGNSSSTVVYRGKTRPGIMKGLRKVLGTQRNTYNAQAVLTSPAGYQAYSDLYSLGNPYDIARIWNSVGNQWPPNTGGTVNPATRRVFMKEMSVEYQFVNGASLQARFSIYDCILRRDLDSSYASTATNAIVQGTMDTTKAAAVAGQEKILGHSPFQSPMFTQHWKVTKVHHVVLEPGGIHIHRCVSKVNKLIPRYWTADTDILGWKGFTRFAVIRQHGTPIMSGTTGTATVSPTQLLCVIKYNFAWQWLFETEEYNSYLDQLLGTITTNGAMDKETDQLVPFVVET